MKIIDVSSNMLFSHAEDGRYIFQPWGKFGGCYQLTEKQRIVRAVANLLYYFLLFGVLISYIGPDLLNKKLLIAFVLLMVLHQFLLCLYTRGLTKTEAPERPSQEYRQKLGKINAEAMGQSFLWFRFIVALAFIGLGVLIGFVLGKLFLSFLAVTFFGFCAVRIFRQIKRLES